MIETEIRKKPLLTSTTPRGTLLSRQIFDLDAPGNESGSSILPSPRRRTPSSAVYAIRSAERTTSVEASFAGLATSATSAAAISGTLPSIRAAAACSSSERFQSGVRAHSFWAFAAQS